MDDEMAKWLHDKEQGEESFRQIADGLAAMHLRLVEKGVDERSAGNITASYTSALAMMFAGGGE